MDFLGISQQSFIIGIVLGVIVIATAISVVVAVHEES